MEAPCAKRARNRSLRKYWLPYLLISLIPVLVICLAAGIGTGYFLSRQAESSLQDQLARLQKELDAGISYMEESAGRLGSLLPSGGSPVDEQMLSGQLALYQENLKMPGTAVYYPRPGTEVYTAEGKLDFHAFETSEEVAGQLEMIQLYTKLNTLQSRAFLSSRYLNGEEGTLLVYLCPVQNPDASSSGVLAFFLQREAFDQTVAGCFPGMEGDFWVFDSFWDLSCRSEGNNRFSTGEAARALPLSGGGEPSHLRFGGVDATCLTAVSDHYGFTYLYALPDSVCYGTARTAALCILLSGALLAALLALAAFCSARKQAKPVMMLAELMEQDGSPAGKDLFGQIQRQYLALAEENACLRAEKRRAGEQALFRELLEGWRGSRAQLEEAMAESGVFPPYPCFMAAVVSSGSGEWIAARLQSGGRKVWLAEKTSRRPAVLIWNFPSGSEGRVRRELEAALASEPGNPVRIGLGRSCTSLTELSVSFCEAQSALYDEAGPLCIYRDPFPLGALFSAADGRALQQGILSGDEEAAVSTLRRMTANADRMQAPFSISRCFCYAVVELLSQVEAACGPLPAEELLCLAGRAEIPQFGARAEKVVRQFCRSAASGGKRDADELGQALFDYIRGHFGEYDLNAESIAGHFGVSAKTVRQAVKDLTGQSFYHLLTSLRMEYVKRQLAGTNLSVRELIEQAGYLDLSSFTRKFRQLEGVTPGQYRENIRKMGTPQTRGTEREAMGFVC